VSVAAIITRLEGLSTLATVEAPSRINPLERDSYPVATVYPSQEEPEDEGALISMTRMRRTYLVVLTVDSPATLETVRDAVVERLSGWQPAAGFGAMEYTSGKLEGINGALLQWACEFQTVVCYDA